MRVNICLGNLWNNILIIINNTIIITRESKISPREMFTLHPGTTLSLCRKEYFQVSKTDVARLWDGERGKEIRGQRGVGTIVVVDRKENNKDKWWQLTSWKKTMLSADPLLSCLLSTAAIRSCCCEKHWPTLYYFVHRMNRQKVKDNYGGIKLEQANEWRLWTWLKIMAREHTA